MDRIEFINKTCMGEGIQKAILERFWNQYMTVYSLAADMPDLVEVIPNTLPVGSRGVSFELAFRTEQSVDLLYNRVNEHHYFRIYDQDFTIMFHKTAPKSIQFLIDVY